MYKLCKTEQSALRQRQLEDGLVEAMLLQRYEDISVSDFCDQLGVPRKSFYRYFTSKDGALHAMVDHRLMECASQDNAGMKNRGADESLLIWFFEYWKSQKRFLDALARSGLSALLAERSIGMSDQAGMFDFDSKKVPKNFQQLANTFVVCGLITLVIQWHADGFQESTADMARMTRLLLTQPLVPENT